MAITWIYIKAPSVTDGPTVYHDVGYEASRNGTTITLNIYYRGYLAYSTSYMGSGKIMDFKATCVYNGITYSATYRIKDDTAEWNGTENDGDPNYYGLRTCMVTLVIPNVGNVNTLTLTTETIRAEGPTHPGTHSRTNTISIPSAIPPSVPGIAVSPALVNLNSNVTITMTNNGTGSGNFDHYVLQYNLGSGWMTYGSFTGNSIGVSPSAIGATYASNINFRAYIYNTLGQSTLSAQSSTVTVVSRPAAPSTVVFSVPVLSTIAGETVLTITPGSAGSGTLAGYIIKIKRNADTNYVTASTNASSPFSLVPSQFLSLAQGDKVDVQIYAVNSYGAVSASPLESSFAIADVPTAVYNISLRNSAGTVHDNIDLLWAPATCVYGTITYEVAVIYRNAAGTLANAVTLKTGLTSASCTLTQADYASISPAPHGAFIFVITARTSYNLASAVVAAAEFTFKGGIAHIKSGGNYSEGIVYYKEQGVWKEATAIYKNSGGQWLESL